MNMTVSWTDPDFFPLDVATTLSQGTSQIVYHMHEDFGSTGLVFNQSLTPHGFSSLSQRRPVEYAPQRAHHVHAPHHAHNMRLVHRSQPRAFSQLELPLGILRNWLWGVSLQVGYNLPYQV